MRESGELCCIDLLSDFDYVWDVGFVRFSDTSHEFEQPLPSFDDLNDAIDAAYMLWKGTWHGGVIRREKR
jgi:hypothetical protein